MRLAQSEDMQSVYAIFSDAIADMNVRGIHQWDEIYPTPAILNSDLAKGQLYVGESEADVVGVVVLSEECDPQYSNGKWLGVGPFVIVHRLCISPDVQGTGIGRGLMIAVEAWAKAHEYTEVRLDAFSLNPQALRMYDRLGYVKRGEANWRKGLFFLMEKSLV